jgi:predicted esterase
MVQATVEEPVAGERAFREDSSAAIQSRAAILLLLGRQARARPLTVADRVAEAPPETESFDESQRLQVPTLDLAGARVPRSHARQELQGFLQLPQAKAVARHITGDRFATLFTRLRDEPSRLNAALLLEAGVRHADLLTRVCAAWSYATLDKADPSLVRVLREGVRSDDALTRDVSAMALSQFAPKDRELGPHTGAASDGAGTPSKAEALLVHGTWARLQSWWQPGGDFHSFVRQHVRTGLYSGPDRFEWSGQYSDPERARAANELEAWVASHSLSGLDVIGHSHGANVAMSATMRGLEAGTLVLLSCPVHESKYLPDLERVRRVVSLHVRLDLVILLDRGEQAFRTSGIEEHRLPIWFQHSATHDPAVWERYDVKRRLKL